MIKYFDINEDKINIKCKLFYNDIQSVNRVLISCHGFGGSKENNASKKLSEYILERYKDICILTFDWPCHGTDVRKSLSLKDCNNYFEHVINYTKKKFKTNEIYLNATSFGGYLSLKYLYEHECPFKRIIIRCPAVTMHSVLSNNILTEEDEKSLSKNKPVEFGFDRKFLITKEFIDELKENDLFKFDYKKYKEIIEVYHGTNDELVPIEDVEKFCLKNTLKFIKVDGADHRFQDPSKINKFVQEGVNFLFNS